MTKEQLEKLINSRRKFASGLEMRITETNSTEHVRAIGETLKAVRDEINDLEKQLAELEKEEPDKGEQQNEGEEHSTQDDSQRSNAEFRGFEFMKAYSRTADKAPNGLALRANESMLDRLPAAERKNNLDFGKLVKGVVTGNWTGADKERRATSTSAVGAVIPSVISAKIIDYARNNSLFANAGVPIVPMSSNNMTIARVANDPVIDFKAEGAEVTESNFSLDSVELKTKTLYGYAYVTLEAIHSATNLTDILYKSFSAALANAWDKGILYGGNENAPGGIMNDSDINVIDSSTCNHPYDPFVKAYGSIRRNNGTPTVLGYNADTEEKLAMFVNGNGDHLDKPEMWENLNKIVSNQLETGENGSDAIMFDPNALMIGQQVAMSFKLLNDEQCIKRGLVGIQIYCMVDGLAVQPKHVCKITNLTNLLHT